MKIAVMKMTHEQSNTVSKIKYDREAKIRKIINTTFNLLSKHDFERITTRQIAKEAGVSIGTIYLYFPAGKEDIIKNMVSFVKSSLQSDDINRNMEVIDLNTALNDWLNRFLAFHQENRSILLAFEKASLKRPEIFKDVNLAIELESLKASPVWAQIPEIKEVMQKHDRTLDEMRKFIMQAVRIIDVIVHRHVLFLRLYEEDDQLIQVLIRIFREMVLK